MNSKQKHNEILIYIMSCAWFILAALSLTQSIAIFTGNTFLTYGFLFSISIGMWIHHLGKARKNREFAYDNEAADLLKKSRSALKSLVGFASPYNDNAYHTGIETIAEINKELGNI